MRMLQLGFYTTTTVHLSLEDFYNAGITPERAKEIIETFRDTSGPMRPAMRLFCSPAGINNNWKFNLMTRDSMRIDMFVEDISYALNLELAAAVKPKKEALK